MVTTTIDLTVTVSGDEIHIIYLSDDLEHAYEGYWNDYETRAITEVICPMSVVASAHAYEYSRLTDASKIFIQPLCRPSARNGGVYGHFE